MADTDDLIRRLRKWGTRWPHQEATAALTAEAADELERLRAEVGHYRWLVGVWVERSRAVREDLTIRSDWRVPVLGAEEREIEGRG